MVEVPVVVNDFVSGLYMVKNSLLCSPWWQRQPYPRQWSSDVYSCHFWSRSYAELERFDRLHSASCLLCTLSLLHETKSQQLVNMAVWKSDLLSLLWPWKAQLYPTVLSLASSFVARQTTSCLFLAFHLPFIERNSANWLIVLVTVRINGSCSVCIVTKDLSDHESSGARSQRNCCCGWK